MQVLTDLARGTAPAARVRSLSSARVLSPQYAPVRVIGSTNNTAARLLAVELNPTRSISSIIARAAEVGPNTTNQHKESIRNKRTITGFVLPFPQFASSVIISIVAPLAPPTARRRRKAAGKRCAKSMQLRNVQTHQNQHTVLS